MFCHNFDSHSYDRLYEEEDTTNTEQHCNKKTSWEY